GVLRLCCQHFPITGFGALRVPACFEREPEVVEHARVAGDALERALEMGYRHLVLAALAQAVTEMEQCFGVVRIDLERFTPRRLCAAGITIRMISPSRFHATTSAGASASAARQ